MSLNSNTFSSSSKCCFNYHSLLFLTLRRINLLSSFEYSLSLFIIGPKALRHCHNCKSSRYVEHALYVPRHWSLRSVIIIRCSTARQQGNIDSKRYHCTHLQFLFSVFFFSFLKKKIKGTLHVKQLLRVKLHEREGREASGCT